MKLLKITFAIIAALWALALTAKLVTWLSHTDAPLAFSHIMGSTVGILIASAIRFTLFKSALRS